MPINFPALITIIVLFAFIVGCAETGPTTAVLVKDIRPDGSSVPRSLTNMNGTLFFVADDGVHGLELWKSDGTDAGTTLVKDIRPGVEGSFINDSLALANVNGTLFFGANDGAHGFELWKSDGTDAGTVLVKDVSPGADSFSVLLLTDVDGTLFFKGGNNTGYELWISDGTDAGTHIVKDLSPGPNDSSPFELTNVNGILFFRASSGISSESKLWKSDGTEAGTVLVKDIYPRDVTDVDGTVFFTADDGNHGLEIWKSDGSEDGTVLVKDVWPGEATSNPRALKNVQGTLFFSADDGANGRELWKSDGTEDGTVLVKDIMSGIGDSNAGGVTDVDGTAFFSAFSREQRTELWKSDGREGGTVLVKDIDPRPWQPQGPGGREVGSSKPSGLTNVNGTLLFVANDGTTGRTLWKSDGTEKGTVLVKDIRPGFTTSAVELIDVDGTLFFVANGNPHGVELWKTGP